MAESPCAQTAVGDNYAAIAGVLMQVDADNTDPGLLLNDLDRAGGNSPTPLIVTRNSNATATAVQVLLRNIAWRSKSSTPARLSRSISVSLSDGDGGLSPELTGQINILLQHAEKFQLRNVLCASD